MTHPRPPVRLTEEDWEMLWHFLWWYDGLQAHEAYARRLMRKIGMCGKLAAMRGVAAVKGKGRVPGE